MRYSAKERNTLETRVKVEINLDGKGEKNISTGIRFFDHMLEQLAAHSGFDIKIDVQSLDSDPHHIVEDVAITIGSAFLEALGDKRGINRYGEKTIPMDEALAQCVIDLSGRIFSKVDADFKEEKTSDFEIILVPHFFQSFAQSSLSTIHINVLDGVDPHHKVEAIFKSFARAIKVATTIDVAKKDVIPSTKGVL
ncbi:MAG: imidazoleglycerol-phosphate dehydratase HisB [Candidatus Gastranaerophilales bacterium]|nr:imidazoleglycerol-phosphate dehydratase HisB [Candidatus Gastranaerophilales bacterium]